MPPRRKKTDSQPTAPREPLPPVSFVKDEAQAAREREKLHGNINLMAVMVLDQQWIKAGLAPVSIRPISFKDDEYPEVSIEVSCGTQVLQSHVGWAIDREGIYPTKVKSEVSGTLCNTLGGALCYQAALDALVRLTALVEGCFEAYQEAHGVTSEAFHKKT